MFAVATLELMLGKENCDIVRTRDEALLFKAEYVVDVGGVYDPDRNRFDHHQTGGAGTRANGVPYASFGLVWKKFGTQVAGSQEAADVLDRILVQSIDSGDVGFDNFKMTVENSSLYFIGDGVELFRATWREDGDWDNRFAKAVEWARELLERQLQILRDTLEAEKVVREIYKHSADKKIIIFNEEHVFGREIITRVLQQYPEPIYAVLIRPDYGNWQLVAVKVGPGSFAMRKPLPESWRGKRDEELKSLTGAPTVVFCHNTGFMCVADDKEDAVMLAKKALEQ